MILFFFFSSRRRHTRFKCDWSSDVCSSDLAALHPPGGQEGEGLLDTPGDLARWARQAAATPVGTLPATLTVRSLELQFPEWANQRILARAIAEVVATGRVAEERQAPVAGAAAGGGTGDTAPAGSPAPPGAPARRAPRNVAARASGAPAGPGQPPRRPARPGAG